MEYISILSIDIETKSSTELRKGGVYRYAADPDFKTTLLTYSYDDGQEICLDLTKQEIPDFLVRDILSPHILKTAYNAAFEIACLTAELSKQLGYLVELDPAQWECTMVKCLMLGLPGSLADVSRVLGLSEGKMSTGLKYINYFCKPCKPTKTNGFRTWNLPEHAPQMWEEFKTYNIYDVKAEKGVLKKVAWFKVPERERMMWILDQKINRLGVKVDVKLLETAVAINKEYQDALVAEAVRITGLRNPRSVTQLKNWLIKEIIEQDEDIDGDVSPDKSLKAEVLPKLIKKFDSEKIKRVLQIRQETSKTSITKYQAMLNAVGSDGRIRGTIQYYGANRTGRFAGRIIQPHNYPRNNMKELDRARRAVKTGCTGIVNTCFDSVPQTLSQLLRTSFIPEQGYEFIPDDYAQIEARVLPWLAGEDWVLDVFRSGRDVYAATAANMLKIPIDQIGKKSPERQRGKVATLALGYQGAVGALIKMGAIEMGIPERELPKLVVLYRQANPHIVQYWEDLQNAAIDAIMYGETVPISQGMQMRFKRNCLFITLPSGRDLVYCNAAVVDGRIQYWGVNQTKKTWMKIDTYGGKLAENITQAVARDILREGLLNLDAHGIRIPLHIHDEVIAEVPIGKYPLEYIDALMCPDISWAKGLPLAADGFKSMYYKKED
jgi:DNA polymerase